MLRFYVYILRCADGSYYVGHTDDLEKRMSEYDGGAVEGYVSRRLPVRLVHSSDFETRLEALTAERQLKGWSRAKKEAFIAGDWTRLRRLARGRTDRHKGRRRPDCGPSTPGSPEQG